MEDRPKEKKNNRPVEGDESDMLMNALFTQGGEEETPSDDEPQKPSPGDGEADSPYGGSDAYDAEAPLTPPEAPEAGEWLHGDFSEEDSVPHRRAAEDAVEPFVPTDFYVKSPKRKRHHGRKRRTALWIVLILLGVLLLVGGLFAYKLLYNPSSFFGAKATPTPGPTAEVAVQQLESIDATPTPPPSPTPTVDPYQQVYQQADVSLMQNIVNVLVIGVDYAEERETWNGKHDYHSDVMMVVAINFDENRVDLISLPRDTYAKIPGVEGIYKLNASLNCGGGFEAPGGAGFLKTCEAASWMLGGIPVDYYYAVTMPAVKGLVDAVGGVDYELEMSYKMMGRSYKAGQQHMDGQGVLDYLRVRKNISASGDVNRVNRQKNMMVALFKSMQQQNLVLKIPDIVSSFDGQLYTNCTTAQTAALAAFAYKLDSGSIGMYSMGSKGGGNTNIFNWNFCLTDQENRVKIIKTVYGKDVPEELEYTPTYAKFTWFDVLATYYLDNVCPSFTKDVSNAIATGTLTPDVVDPNFPGGVVDPNNPGGVIDPNYPGGTVDPNYPGGGTVDPNNPGGEFMDPNGLNGTAPMGTTGGGVTYGYLSLSRPAPAEGYSSFDQQLFEQYKNSVSALEDARNYAREEAEKYRNGQSNSLSHAATSVSSLLSEMKSQAQQLASAFGLSGSKFESSYTYRYDKDPDFNQVAVDFN